MRERGGGGAILSEPSSPGPWRCSGTATRPLSAAPTSVFARSPPYQYRWDRCGHERTEVRRVVAMSVYGPEPYLVGRVPLAVHAPAQVARAREHPRPPPDQGEFDAVAAAQQRERVRGERWWGKRNKETREQR